MSVQDELDAFRDAVEGCQLVAFADLQARLVLVSSSATRAKRDVLDALCSETADFFAIADQSDAESGLDSADTGVSATEEGMTFFIRDPEERGEALAIVCSVEADPAQVLGQAQTILPRLLSPGEDA